MAPRKGKKRGRAPPVATPPVVTPPDETEAIEETEANEAGPSKRAKTYHTKPPAAEVAAVSPTLVPQRPEPIPPLPLHINPEDFQFFDRVKKYIGNKSTYNEFLKLCNLYIQDLLDKNALAERASSFIGGNAELMGQLKRMIHSDEPKSELFAPQARPSSGRVNLSHCRALGPSYRLLPKRERLKHCSGRDDLCHHVLNDEWASHPTWASEDSGFVAHRKNSFEEVLHRIEEERHDYDFNIEACARTIQLMEPIAQNFKHMSQEERDRFILDLGLGGQSRTIYQRVIKKIYDRERGQKVIDDMFGRPAAVLPIVLHRLKQKLEEWKAGQVGFNPFPQYNFVC
jgi:paired amphipathic helix protein Sin3a